MRWIMRRNRRRSPSYRAGAPQKSSLLLWSFIFVCFIMILSFIYINKQIKPTLMDIANEKTIEFATRTINSAVKSTEEMSFEDLVVENYDVNGNITTLGWNSDVMNRALRSATERAEYFLYGMNKGEQIDLEDPNLQPIEFGDTVADLAAKDPTVIEIPLGQITGNTVLANLGPKIPVHFEMVGSLRSDVVHEMKEFGVNNVLVEIYIPVSVNIKIVVPFSSETAEVTTKVFVDSRVIMGSVPDFYSGGGASEPHVIMPRREGGE